MCINKAIKRGWLPAGCAGMLALAGVLAGCGGSSQKHENRGFFTSGSREADQRATQRMAREEQIAGSGEGAGESGVKKARASGGAGTGAPGAAQAEEKLSLYERLGGESGIKAIIDDFTPRVLQDPRVNWERRGVKRGGLLSREKGPVWTASPENVARLKKHLTQFIALATGGPARYEGKDLQADHADMRITNPEFDAVVGDLKATLDKLQIPNKEQKELLAVIESTRPQIVTER